MNEVVMILYHVLALIFAVTGIVVLRGRSSYPDMKAGYRVKEAMKNKESWEYANSFCGKLCIAFTVVFLLLPRFLISAGTGTVAAVAVLIVCGALAVCMAAVCGGAANCAEVGREAAQSEKGVPLAGRAPDGAEISDVRERSGLKYG